MRETDRMERLLVTKAERAENQQRVESAELVFGTERAKLQGERGMWLWVLVGGGVSTTIGVIVGIVPGALQSRASRVFSRLG